MKRLGVLLGTVVVAALLAGCGGGGAGTTFEYTGGSALEEALAEPEPGAVTVSKSGYGGGWPLTVSSGTLSCDGPKGAGSVVFTTPGGTRYGVNGTAQDQLGLPAIDAIWRSGSNIGPLLDQGLALCG